MVRAYCFYSTEAWITRVILLIFRYIQVQTAEKEQNRARLVNNFSCAAELLVLMPAVNYQDVTFEVPNVNLVNSFTSIKLVYTYWFVLKD